MFKEYSKTPPIWKAAFIMAAVVVGIGLMFGYFYYSARQSGEAYKVAPLCAEAQNKTAACRNVTSAVVVQKNIYSQKNSSNSTYYADFRLPSSKIVTPQLTGDIFRALKEGETMTVEVWDGQIVQVKIADKFLSTRELPESATRGYFIMGVLITSIFGFVVALVFLLLFLTGRGLNNPILLTGVILVLALGFLAFLVLVVTPLL